MSFVSELRRRQVFRAAAWYAAGAWVVIQVASTVFPEFGFPSWSVRAVIVAALLGFPVAMLLAWSFDLSRAGLHKETSARAETPPTVGTAVWRLPSLWFALALGAGLAVTAQQAWQRVVRPSLDQRPTLAVLPFANLSPDPANAYFADGLHEEILATLARTAGLRVISRTSVQKYRDTKLNLREIADALEATHILEGSVRRDGDNVRLTLQLIDGRTDEHLWAESYDRRLRDALRLQQTVAQQVAVTVGATLTLAEQQLMKTAAPTVPEAYETYLQALALYSQHATEAQLRAVVSLLDQTTARDPGFAVARALRSKARIWLALNFLDRDSAMLDAARADFERALQLHPDLPEALTARALYRTYVEIDPERALPDLSRALAIAPNDPDSHNSIGLSLRRLGRYDEALEHFREATRLTPGQERYAFRTFETLLGLGRLEEAELERQLFEEHFPAFAPARLVRYWIRFLETGETAGWREDNERLFPLVPDRDLQAKRFAYATNDVAFYIRAVASDPERTAEDRAMDLGLAYSVLGDAARARPQLELAVSATDSRPDDPMDLSVRAVALALLGRHRDALQTADRALQLAPARRADIVNYAVVAQWHAWVLIYTRQRAEEGYRELESLVGEYGVAPQALLVLPPWRLLRDDPRIQAIVRSKLPR